MEIAVTTLVKSSMNDGIALYLINKEITLDYLFVCFILHVCFDLVKAVRVQSMMIFIHCYTRELSNRFRYYWLTLTLKFQSTLLKFSDEHSVRLYT